MKLSLLIFTIAVFYTRVALGRLDRGSTTYLTFFGSLLCTAQTRECCSQASRCKIRYEATGDWMALRDRVATGLACKFLCLDHFKKCVDLCDIATRLIEVESRKLCKCKLSEPIFFVKKSCKKHCLEARASCVKARQCNTKTCPLLARTTLEWDEEFDGRCVASCKPKHALKKVCTIKG